MLSRSFEASQRLKRNEPGYTPGQAVSRDKGPLELRSLSLGHVQEGPIQKSLLESSPADFFNLGLARRQIA